MVGLNEGGYKNYCFNNNEDQNKSEAFLMIWKDMFIILGINGSMTIKNVVTIFHSNGAVTFS